jgi:hypothetical protein
MRRAVRPAVRAHECHTHECHTTNANPNVAPSAEHLAGRFGRFWVGKSDAPRARA